MINDICITKSSTMDILHNNRNNIFNGNALITITTFKLLLKFL